MHFKYIFRFVFQVKIHNSNKNAQKAPNWIFVGKDTSHCRLLHPFIGLVVITYCKKYDGEL